MPRRRCLRRKNFAEFVGVKNMRQVIEEMEWVTVR